jgi:hypothetical protein
MTQPQSPDTFTFEEALAAVAAAQTAVAARDAVAATVLDLSTAVINAREVAAAYAKTLIWALWADTDPYDGNAVEDFTVSAAVHMVTAQTTTARTAAAAQSAILQTMGIAAPGVTSNPVDVRAPGADVVDGALVLQRPDSVRVSYDTRADTRIRAENMTTQGMFNRPARTLRAVEAAGATREVADAQARDRIDQLVEDNVMLAQRFAEAEVLQRVVDLDAPGPRIIGYRRVIHPELSETGVCGLCIAAADQRYKVGDLLPIHARCKCTVAAITEDHDPADDVNAADLGALYDLAGGTAGPGLKRVRYQLDEHGELGPVLVPQRERKPRKDYQREYVRRAKRTSAKRRRARA